MLPSFLLPIFLALGLIILVSRSLKAVFDTNVSEDARRLWLHLMLAELLLFVYVILSIVMTVFRALS